MIGQTLTSSSPQNTKPYRVSVHILSDESLVKVFYYCRPVRGDTEADRDGNGIGEQGSECRWWYTLAHVCQKWRHLVLASASHLGLCLICTYGTPVADMLEHSPLFPIIIDYSDASCEVTADDEEGILLALRHCHRVRRIRLRTHNSKLQNLVATMDAEFSILQALDIKPLTDDDDRFGLVLPKTFRAPLLRQPTVYNVPYSPTIFCLPSPTPRVQSPQRNGLCTQDSSPQLRARRYVLPSVLSFIRSGMNWARSMSNRVLTSIHILDDDSLLNIFSFCRLPLIDEDETDDLRILRGGYWDRERWWYKVSHVCRRWRSLLLASASCLGLGLHCTYGTPVADILAHSPPLPLIIDCLDGDHDVIPEDEARIMLALRQRDRVRRIRLLFSLSTLLRFVTALDGEFPILEHLYLRPSNQHDMRITLPEAFHAPHLRHLMLSNFAIPIGSPLLATASAKGLVTLMLAWIHPSIYFHPSDLLQRLSLMPSLTTLWITFHSPFLSHSMDSERELLDKQAVAHVTLPNLHWLVFYGTTAYLEALLPWMTTPSLERLYIWLSYQDTYSFPSLVRFMNATETFRTTTASLDFNIMGAKLKMYPHEADKRAHFFLEVPGGFLDWQISSMAQIFIAPIPVSSVECLTLRCDISRISFLGQHHQANRSQWREILRRFGNVKTLQVDSELVGDITHSLQPDNGESPAELLPDLKELLYYGTDNDGDPFKSFADIRRNAGRPVTIVRGL